MEARQGHEEQHVAKKPERDLKQQSSSDAAQPQFAIHHDLSSLIATSSIRLAEIASNFADCLGITTSRS
jgi:hypothetical protein